MRTFSQLFMLASIVLLSSLTSAQSSDLVDFVWLDKQQVFFKKNHSIPVAAYATFGEDKGSNWKTEDIFAGKYQQHFTPVQKDFAFFGFTDSTYWLLFELDLSRSQFSERLLLVMNAATLDDLSLFTRTADGQIFEKKTGYLLPDSSKDYEHHYYIFSIDDSLASPQTFLLRVRSNTSLLMPLELWRSSDFYKQDYFNTLFIGAYYGVLLVMFFYNLFIYLSIRDKSYLFYILFIASYGLMQFTLDGMLGYLVWEEFVKFRGFDVVLTAGVSGILAILFGMSFLQTKTTLPRLHNVMQATIALEIIFVLVSLVSGVMLVNFIVYLSLWVTLLLIVVGVFALRAGQHGAKYFLFAWTFLLAGSASYLLTLMGIISNIFLMTYGMKLGSGIEVILLSLGLADRINQERRTRELLQFEKADFESRARLLATVDTRTSMPNRAQLQQCLHRYSQDKKPFALILMKVMRFKQINNTLGHEHGDELLKLLALKIDSVFSKKKNLTLPVGNNAEGISSVVAVVDSLTFAAIIAESEARFLNDFAIELREEISGTIEFKQALIDLEIVMGLSSNDHYQVKSPEKIVHEAQVGLSAATRLEQRIAIYSPLIDPYSEKQLSLMAHLRKAVADEALSLYYQPQIDIKTMQLIGFEALLRWKDSEGNYVSPISFIPLAESCGVIRPLTRWVIRKSLLTLAELQKRFPEIYVSINLSVSNLREDDLVQYVREQIKMFSVKPASIKFEITESSMIENEELALNRLLQLRRLGCQISVDDYGSGYASLGYLKQLPISEVKIDRTFIRELAKNHDDQVIVRATIKMCHDLGLKVVAEGVETNEVLNLLESFECDVAQGYLLGKPVPISDPDIQDWLNKIPQK